MEVVQETPQEGDIKEEEGITGVSMVEPAQGEVVMGKEKEKVD